MSYYQQQPPVAAPPPQGIYAFVLMEKTCYACTIFRELCYVEM
jgi:hypothetical protein